MAETNKRNTNSASKNRKSKNEIIRSALGMYLKQRNYTASEKFRKSDFALTQNQKQMEFGLMLEDDLSKANSILYSNVLCLSNNSNMVDLQFTKFLQFVQSQNMPIKNELQNILSPLLCHLYIELLKGRDYQPALGLLKKYAYVVGPVDNLDNPLAHKINGSAVAVLANDPSNIIPSATTHITFIREPENENTLQEYFKNLVQLMSTCLRIEEVDSMELTRNFRYSKFEMELSLQSLYALKQFLVKNGHAVILHILQTWFSFEITDANDLDEGDTNYDAENRNCTWTDSEDTDSDFDASGLTNFLKKMRAEYGIENLKIKNNKLVTVSDVQNKPAAVPETDASASEIPQRKRSNKLRNMRRAVIKMKIHEQPIRVLQIMNADNKLSSGDMDSSECHLVCGFDDSTIKLWQLNQSRISGTKPFATFASRSCGWSLDDQYDISSSDDDDDDDDEKPKILPNFARKISKEEREEQYLGQQCNTNIFTDSGGISLRGHSKGVTDTLFSQHHPLLFSVSKDQTMRAWKSSNYTCGAVYRGHNYPIWCVAESPVGLYIATGSRDLTARLWSTDREYPLQTYIGHTQDIDAIDFHPNGNYIATGSTDLTVRLWCVTSGKLFRVFTDCHLPVQCVSFSPDGKLLAAAGEESKIRIFDLAAGSQLSELKDHTAPVTNLEWNSIGNKLASCCADGSIRVFNVTKLGVQSPQSSSTPTSTNKLLLSYGSGCKRAIKTFFNLNGSISCIGN